ncbi:DUF3040 domain-containing protein [Kocuria palustris]|uniref:DUF3040 domain-containing protein n=1 Tax=Kocuria palustris TaxID=71999 RepID=UPI0028D0694A|nr:DUF3040 domain-containing protein [Kocuria palustris]
MALSEREQQLLAQLEQQLNAEDPRFVSQMDSRPVKPTFSTRALVLGAVIGVVGLGIVVGGVAMDSILVGVLGFLIMSFGVYWASTRSSGAKEAGESSSSRGGAKAKPAAAKKPQSSFMRNLENRWDERRNGS